MNVLLEFSGGAELLVGRIRQHKIILPTQDGLQHWTISCLLHWIKKNLFQERPELFLKDPEQQELDVRPGILALVNDADWDCLNKPTTSLK